MFCDYCDCNDCVYGSSMTSHAQTAHGAWICDACYLYSLCVGRGPMRSRSGPCKNMNCPHRPTIVTEWIKYEQNHNY